jgi:predicted MFS family arabinose efflux permease
LTLVGGVLADRRDRRRVITLFQSIQMVCPTLIAVLLMTGSVTPWLVIVLSLVVGVTDALSMPSFASIVPSIVERPQIARGLALNATQFNLSRILGPAIAGLLMASVGAAACFALSAASYIPFIGVALWILPRHVVKSTLEHHARGRPWTGLRDVVRVPHLRGALLTVLVTSTLCAPLITFVPVLVNDAFHGNAAQFSLAVGAFGAGGLLGSFALLGVPSSQDRRRWSWFAALAYSVVLMATAMVPWFWGLPVLLVFCGALMTVSNTSANTLLQSTADPALLGQSASLFMLAMRGGMSLGSLVTGAVVDAIGVQHALLLNGAVALVAHAVLGRLWVRTPLPAVVESNAPGVAAPLL